MKTYELYKDSCVKGVGEIPEHWKVMTLRRVCDLQQGLQIPISERFLEEVEGALEYITTKSIHNPNDYRQYVVGAKQNVICLEDDVLLGRTGNTGEVVTDVAGVFHNNFFKVDYDKNRIEKKFIVYFLKTTLIQELIKLVAGTTTIPDLNHGDFLNLPFLFPLLEEQNQIAKYLDHKTSIIDSLIEKKEQLIKKLQAQRQAIINEAVTKGLNPNAKTKDSGIEWLGEIPEHWEVVKFRYKFNTTKGLTITKSNLLDKGIPCVNYGEIHSKYGFEVNPEINKLKYVSEDYLDTNENSLLHKGDFVFADTSEDIEGAGNFTHLNSAIPTFAGYHTIIARLIDNSNYRFVAYFFDSKAYRTQIQNFVKGVKVYSITNKILKDTFLFFPPENEQEVIAHFIDSKVSKIFSSRKKLEESIKKLKSYRQSIISEAVTGKIDVRDWQPKTTEKVC